MTYKSGDILKDKYRIIEKLGSGSMGEVYRAEHQKLHKEVAIKLMHVHVAENPEALARFKREAHSAAKLEHPHICAVTDFDSTDKGDFYIVMEYLHGETLKTRLAREGRIEIHSALRIMDDLLSALECAHEENVIHRDIKPENIVLKNREGRNDYVKLIDFGIAHTDAPGASHFGTLTHAGQVYGTPHYLSPEQVLGEPVDARADLYSVGCTLYEMLAGHPPFDGENYIVLLNKHLALDAPPLPNDFPASAELNLIVLKLLQKSPNDRFTTAKELREILADIAKLVGPSPSTPPSNGSPLKSFLASSGFAALDNLEKQAASDGAQPAVTVQQTAVSSQQPAASSTQNAAVSANGLAKVEETPTNSADSATPVQTDNKPASSKNNLTGILISLLVVVVLVLSLLLYFTSGSRNGFNSGGDQTDNAESHKTQASGFAITPEMLTAYAERECRIATDKELANNEDVRKGAEECLTKHYSEAKAHFDKVKSAYAHNLQFWMMYLVDVYSMEQTDEAISAIVHIFEFDSAAVCDPVLANIIYALIENDEAYEKLSTNLKALQSPYVSNGIAWLILNTPCNEYQLRFERLLECYDTLASDLNTRWLFNAVRVWRPFMPSGSCDLRLKHVEQFVIDGLNKSCNDPDSSHPNSRCSICYNLWHEKNSKK